MVARARSRDRMHRVREFVLASAAEGAGRKLPAEREFAQRYDLPRNAVRRMLAELEAEGWIRREVGRGTFVAVADGNGARSPAAASPAQLMEARLRVEPAAVELVVVHATAADFERMDHCLDRAERALTLDEFELWDAAFHQAIAAATHNALIARIFDLFHDARQQAEWGKLRDRVITEALRLDYQRQHRAIVAAFKHRDADAARLAVIAHLTCASRNLFGG
jgi:DNA-binding FadR family transcriptional regulator